MERVQGFLDTREALSSLPGIRLMPDRSWDTSDPLCVSSVLVLCSFLCSPIVPLPVTPLPVYWTIGQALCFRLSVPLKPQNVYLGFSASPTHEILIPRSLCRFFQPSPPPTSDVAGHTSNLVTKHAHCYGNTDALVLHNNDFTWETVLREENASLHMERSLVRERGRPVTSAPWLHLPPSP